MNIKYFFYSLARNVVFSPIPITTVLARYILKKTKLFSFKHRLYFDAVTDAKYAYGIYWSAVQAKRIGLTRITVLEFGVGRGRGLRSMEQITKEVEKELSITIDIYGFDNGTGVPKPSDPRDMGYFWPEGIMHYDAKETEESLTKARVIWGPVEKTVKNFIKNFEVAPIAFIAMDLSGFRSTKAALEVMNCSEAYRLPRVYFYFNSVCAFETLTQTKQTSELGAINRFNEERTIKILKLENLAGHRHFKDIWNDCYYVYNDFTHKLFNRDMGVNHQSQEF